MPTAVSQLARRDPARRGSPRACSLGSERRARSDRHGSLRATAGAHPRRHPSRKLGYCVVALIASSEIAIWSGAVVLASRDDDTRFAGAIAAGVAGTGAIVGGVIAVGNRTTFSFSGPGVVTASAGPGMMTVSF